ncbi:type I DNA topoisomerase [Oxynema sp. CENA135]|uniref:type I DNA topoisomerase n=1 Tax=Oxynema sp. CENA135 TaxID=984206 RepID=UPI00190CEABD|nr:type I DNA topoisomerase [Oxynema sp. CENA135]MBK4730809.1 type I DNA topoisomerase [Oxynema sp. CENA135]
MNLLLIESPGKIKKLSQILGSGWQVKASMGHVRELANDGEDALGFDLIGDRVKCRYTVRSDRAQKTIADLRQAVARADTVYIATDPDREGETIGWHLAHELHLRRPYRVTYTEITPAAVRRAIAHPRHLDRDLVAAGRARDCLDKLVGYKGSKHVVWALKIGAKSMGRVQSATLHLLCQREAEIQAFVPQDYWSCWVEYAEGFKAFYRGDADATSDDEANPSDDAEDRSQKAPESQKVLSQAEADRIVAIARRESHQVLRIHKRNTSQSPPPPFITSTLQQAAGAKLRLSPDKTMKVAQALYEAGHITYMRTDSISLSAEFQAAVRDYLQQHDPSNVPDKVTRYRSKGNAQEAHEAIRPTHVTRTPEALGREVSREEGQLYQLIWNRAVASQCRPAQLAKTRILSQSGPLFWEARGQVVTFAGYTKYWNNISEDTRLPNIEARQNLTCKRAGADKKRTQPPPRYSEPKLVQLMERKGIGRPSTYSPTIKTLKERKYVSLTKGKLQPTDLGMELDGVLAKVLPDLIEANFTAKMERDLDAIADGKLNWESYLTGWNRDYFYPALIKAKQEIKQFVPTRVSEQKSGHRSAVKTEATEVVCPQCKRFMTKVFSRSPKLKADHFLSCSDREGGCGTVMFLNVATMQYELPYSQRKPDPTKLTEHPCPQCGKLLERHEYTREGQQKVMLRCSNPKTRRDKCKEVAFFKTKTDNWWSPKWGELGSPTAKTAKKTPRKQRRTSRGRSK